MSGACEIFWSKITKKYSQFSLFVFGMPHPENKQKQTKTNKNKQKRVNLSEI
jgi:hypothetical protein